LQNSLLGTWIGAMQSLGCEVRYQRAKIFEKKVHLKDRLEGRPYNEHRRRDDHLYYF
jgi:hypothetical protein